MVSAYTPIASQQNLSTLSELVINTNFDRVLVLIDQPTGVTTVDADSSGSYSVAKTVNTAEGNVIGKLTSTSRDPLKAARPHWTIKPLWNFIYPFCE